jgi:hypothetical protein
MLAGRMPSSPSRRERRLWWLAAGLVAFIYASAYFIQFVFLALRERGLLGPTILAAFAATAVALGAWLVRQRPRWPELALLAATALVYLGLLQHLTIIQERVHLLEYGALGGIFYAAFRERWGDAAARGLRRDPGLAACLANGAAGWGDELVQGILPNRVYDNRDVALNAIAGALVVVVAATRRRLRARLPAAAVAPAA